MFVPKTPEPKNTTDKEVAYSFLQKYNRQIVLAMPSTCNMFRIQLVLLL